MKQQTVGIFFVVDGHKLLRTCTHEQAEEYGTFLNYPLSHDEVWQKDYQKRYGVAFDYYPRGRMLYDRDRDMTRIFYDRCIEAEAQEIAENYDSFELLLDEHYQCHQCYADYPELPEE